MAFPRKTNLIAVLLFSLCVQSGLSSLSNAQGPAKGKAKEKTAPPPPPVKEKDPDYSQEAMVVEQLKMLYRFEKDGTGQRELSLRVKVQSEAALQQFGQLVFPYTSANEALEIDYVRVKKADGTAVTASATDVQDLTAPISREAPVYTDVRQKHVTVPGLRPGDVLEYHAIWRLHTPLAPNHFWLSHDFIMKDLIVLDEQLEVDIPRDSTMKLKTEKGFDAATREQAGRRIYTWKHVILKREEAKDDKEEARKRREELEDPKPPQVQLTTFQSWDEVGQWYAGLERDRIPPNDKIRAKAEELVRGRNTDQEKIEALYEFVAKNFRYVSLSLGQGRYQPHAASDVLANQYGDCKDKHTLLASMLIAAGLRAYPALMNSSRKIDADVPSPAQFDHVISAIPLGSETLWADTTAEIAPFRLLSPLLRDKKALVIPANGPAHLETTPAAPPFISTQLIEIEGQISDLGKLTGHAHLTLRGDAEMYFRMAFRRTPKSDWKQLGYVLSASAGIQGEATDIKVSEISALEKPFEVEYNISKNDFLDWSSKKAKLSLPLPSMNLQSIDADKEESTKPISLGAPGNITYRLRLSLPAKYQARIPVALKVTRDYADYSSSYKLDGNVLIVERNYQLRQHELPAARTQDYIAFTAAARADEAQTLSVETDVAGAPAIPESVKVEELVQAAQVAANDQNYPLTEQLLQLVIQKEPKHKTARRQLAFALYAQNKSDAAIEVIREQTKINPYDDYCYDLLGKVYWRQQKYAEAEAAFRKQLEVTPLSEAAQTDLAQMLVDWRKYKEAVPELEKAISLNPEGEMLFVSLGRAYLNLDQPQKATEAFDQAVKLEPGPLVWNDVAYNLALSKVQLDKAQQYAESAVTAIATELRNAEPQRLTLDDVQNVNALVAYWDTLGWVHFQKGNIDVAEKYISAAWLIGQHSEVGYHLGQIMEKRGRNEEAIHTYAQATAGNRLVPEARASFDRLAGKNPNEALLKNASNELNESRTLKLGPALKGSKSLIEAQFFVILIPGPAQKVEVAAVKFIKGDEKLRLLGSSVLKTANYNFDFPDQTITKVIRRGTMYCQPNGGECTFLMMSPEYVFSVD